MKSLGLTGATLLLGYFAATSGDNIPPFLKVCRRSDPKLNECVMTAVEELRPHLVKGIPEFGIPSCEPLEIKEMVLDQGQGVARLTSTYTDIEVHGPTNFKLETVRIDLDRRRVFLKLWLPYLRMTSHYKMDGRLLVLPITGSGYYEGNYTDIQAVCTLHGEHVSIRGQTHFSVKNFDVKFSIGGAKVFLGDLFNGDRELGEAMNLFLNENWKNVATELQPLLEAKIGDVFRQFSNSIYHKFPLDQILPP